MLKLFYTQDMNKWKPGKYCTESSESKIMYRNYWTLNNLNFR